MRDLNINICLFPWLWLKCIPLHVSNAPIVQAEPALELVVGGHFLGK
jgi:hypothetical protein